MTEENSVETSVSEFASVDHILAFNDVKTEVMTIPEWGNVKIKVKGLSKADELAARKMSTTGGTLNEQLLEGHMLVMGIVEPKFERYHINDLQKKGSGVLNKILVKISRLSGLGEDSQKDVEADFQ